MTVYQWFPYGWGVPTNTPEDDLFLHTNILQVVLPVRTGLGKLRSSAVVWRMN